MDIAEMRDAIAKNPTDAVTFEKLQNALLDERKLPELKAVYESVFPAIKDSPDKEKILRLVDNAARLYDDEGIKHWLNAQLGILYWRVLDSLDRAEVYFRRVQDAAGHSGGMVGEFYIEFYARRDNWRRLEELFQKQGLEDIEIKRKLAVIAEERDKKDKALAFWQEVYNYDPSDETVFDRLRQLYVGAEKWHSLVELLKKRLAAVDGDVAAAVTLHFEMVGIYREYIKSETKVIAELQALLKLDPSNADALDQLEQLYEGMKRWPDLVRVLQERIVHATGETKLGLHARIASIMLERFSNASEAIKHYQAILELDGQNLDAIRKLKELYEQRKTWEQYVEVAQLEIRLAGGSPQDRTNSLIQLAGLASEKIRVPRIAVSLWEQILETDPTHADALAQLEQLYERDKAYDKLADIISARADQTSDVAAQVALLEKLGAVISTRLKDEERTADVWRRLLAIQTGHKKAFDELRKRYLAASDFDALEGLYRQHGTLSELTRALEAQVKSESDTGKISLLQRIAGLRREEGNAPKAIAALEEILALDSQNAAAARALIPDYASLGQWDKLAGAYDVVLGATEDAATRRPILESKARIAETQLGDSNAAYFCLVECLRNAPGDTDLRSELDRLAQASDNLEGFAEVLEEALELLDESSPEVLRTTLRVAEIWHGLGSPGRALGHYARVVQVLQPGHTGALAAMEAIYRETGQWDELLELLQDKQNGSNLDAEGQKSLRFEIAAVCRDKLGRAEDAMRVYREMMDQFPDDLRIYDELAQLHLLAEDWIELISVLERKLGALSDRSDTKPQAISELRARLGLEHVRFGESARAVEYFIDALNADGNNDVAIAQLTILMAQSALERTVAEALEPVWVRRGDDKQLAAVIEIQLRYARDKKAKKKLIERLVVLYRDKIADDAAALDAASRLFVLDPEAGFAKGARPTVEAIALKLGAHAALADLYEQNVDRIDEPATRLIVHNAIARSVYEHGSDFIRAEKHFRSILDIDGGHADTLDALEELYAVTEQYELLLEIVLKKEQLATSDDARVAFRFQTATLLAEQLGRIPEAIDDLRRILGIEPGNAQALARLDDLYTRTEAWLDLHDILRSRIDGAASDDDRVSLLVRLAELQETRLDMPTDAVITYADVIAIDFVQPDAVGALERLFAEPDYAGIIAPILEATYQATGRWDGLVAVYTEMERAAETTDEKVDLQFKIAGLYEGPGQSPAQAYQHLGEAYRYDPARETTVKELIRLADVLGDQRGLTVLLAEKVELIADETRRRETQRVIAQTLADKVGDAPKAIEAYRAVLDLAPGDVQATDALITLYRKTEQYPQLVDMLRQRAGLENDVKRKKALLAEAGEIASAAIGAEEAISVYESALEVDPNDVATLDALARVYEETEAWNDLCRILGRKIELESDLETKKAYARELAGVQEQRIEDPDSAIETQRVILGWDEADLAALASLDDLFGLTERWIELIEIIDRQNALGAGDSADLMLRKASVWNEKVGDTGQAINVLSAILTERPQETRAIAALEAIVRDSDEREAAYAALRPVLENSGAWSAILGLSEILVSTRDIPAAQVQALADMATIAEARLNAPENAFSFWGRALALDGDDTDAMAAVERLAKAHGLWEALVELLDAAAKRNDDPSRSVTLRLRAADVLKDEIGAYDRAIVSYNVVLQDDDQNATALLALDELYTATDAHAELPGILARRIDITTDAAEKIGLYFRLADVAENRLGESDRPVECFREIFYLNSNNAAAISELERLMRTTGHRLEIADLLEPVYADRGQWPQLLALLDLRLDLAKDPTDRLDLLRRMASVSLDQLGNKGDALHRYSLAFKIDPGDDSLLERVETLASETGDYASLKETLLAVAIGLQEKSRKIELWHKAALVVMNQLADKDQGERIYEYVLNEDQSDLTALRALDTLYVQQNRWTELDVCLQSQVAAVEFDDERVGLLLRLGELCTGKLGRPADAIAAYVDALAYNETEPTALAALNTLYRDVGEWEPLFDIATRQSEIASDDATRLAHKRDLAELAENKLGRAEDALHLWEDVLSITPADLDAIRHIERLHRGAGNDEGVAEAMERELRTLGGEDPVRASDLYRELGRLFAGKLDDPFKAQEAWERLLDLEDNDVEALKALAKLHEDGSNLEALAKTLEKMVASRRFFGDEVLALWQQLARLYTESVPEPQNAIRAWSQVRDVRPDDLEAVRALETLYSDGGQWAPAVAMMTVKAGLVPAAEAVGVWFAIGEAQQFQLSDPASAAVSYARVLELDNAHQDAGERLEGIYQDSGRFADLAKLLEARADLLDRPEDKRDLFVRLADLYETRLGDLAAALVYTIAAHDQKHGDLDIVLSIERIATVIEQWSDLHEQYAFALDATTDETDRIDIALRDARLLESKLQDSQGAIERYRHVLELNPDHAEAMLEIAGLYEKTGAWEDLVAILERRFGSSNDSFERGEIGVKIGSVLRDQLGAIDRAVDAFKRVLDLGVAEQRVIEALEAIFRSASRYDDLVEILFAKANSGLGNETALKLEIGSIREEKLSDPRGAIDIYESILSLDESNRDSLDRLMSLYADVNDMERLTSVYERLLHAAESDEEQITYCEALAVLQKDVHQNPEAAADYYFRILTIDTKHSDAMAALEELYETMERWEDLIEIFRRRLEQSDDTTTWSSYKEKSARLYSEKLQDLGSAIDAYQQLIDRVPGNRAALDALEALYRADAHWERVQDVLAQKAEYTKGPERLALLIDRARIVLEELSDPDGALEIARRAEVEAPSDATISSLLEAVYGRRGEWDQVVQVLSRRGSHARSDADSAAAEVAIAKVYEEKLHDGEAAIRHYERALELVPSDVQTSERLAGLYVIAEDWIKAEALLSLIVRRAPTDAEPEWMSRTYKNLGLSLENMLRPSEALEAYEQAHNFAPEDMEILKALGRAAEATGDFGTAEKVFTQLIEAARLDATEAELVNLYKTLGQMAFKAGKVDKAREYLEKTVSLQPGSTDALRNLMSLCEQQGYWQGVVEYGVELRDILTEPMEKFELQLRLGDAYLKHLKDIDEAARAYRTALDFQPESKGAHFKIFQVLVDAERYDEAVEILEKLVTLEADPKRKAQYLGAVGDIFREKKGDLIGSVDYYERALDYDSSLLKLFRSIDEILTQAKDWRRLEKAYRNMFKRVADDETQEQLQYKLLFLLGEIYRTRLARPDASKAAFENALERKPRDAKSLQILAEMYEADEQYEDAVRCKRRLLEIEPGNVDHYRDSKRLMFALKDLDGAWVACAVLTLLGQANEKEEATYNQHAPKQIAEDALTPTTNLWGQLFSKGEELLIGHIFWTIYQGIGSQLATKELKDYGLKKKSQIDPNEKELLMHVYRHTVRVLGLNPPPELYHSPKTPGLQLAEILPPVLLVGDNVRQGQTDQELGFVLGKSLTYFHNLHLAVALSPLETLETLFNAAVKLFVPSHDVGALEQNEAFQELLVALGGMPPQLRQGLQRYVGEYIERGQKANLTRWLNQIELTANHVGLLMCNDPHVAGQIIKNEAHRTLFQAPSRLATRDKLVDLAVYSLSEEYLGLRKTLGIAIEAE